MTVSEDSHLYIFVSVVGSVMYTGIYYDCTGL